MFGIIRNAYREKKVKKLAMECKAACLALDAQKARETYDRFLEYRNAPKNDMYSDEWFVWSEATKPIMSYLAPMVLALEGKPNGDPIIKQRMAAMRGEKLRISEAEFPQAATELALRLAANRQLMFESCVEVFEKSSGTQILNRHLTPQVDIELASYQFIHVQGAVREHRYLDEADIPEFFRFLHVASYNVEGEDEESQARAYHLHTCTDRLISLYHQEASNPNEEISLLRGEGVLGAMCDLFGIAICGELEWLSGGCNLRNPVKRLAALSVTVNTTIFLKLFAYWHTAVTFNDEKEIKRLDKEMEQRTEDNMKE